MSLKSTILLIFCLFAFAFPTFGQNSILMVSSATGAKKVLQLSSSDGSLINANFIDLTSQNTGTIKGVAQVNDKIWITDQTNDKVYIYDVAGNYVSSITTALDNLRGVNIVNNEVWVANDGGGNGATADSIMRYTTAGTFIGMYPAPNTSIFDLVDDKNGTVYVSGLDTNGIQKLSYTGATLGNLVAPAFFQNLQQINMMANGNILAAVFQNHTSSGNNAGVYVLSSQNGSIVNYYPVTSGNLRGVIQADNGNILYTTGNALFSINPVTSIHTQLIAGQFQFLTKALIPTLGLNEAESAKFKIYPNPATDFLTVDLQGKLQKAEIFASDGRLITKLAANDGNSFKVNVSDLSTGNYFLLLQIDGKMHKHQFVKKQ